LRNFRGRQAAEEFHLDNPALSLIDPGQFVQRIVQCDQLGVTIDRQFSQILQSDPVAPVTFGRAAIAGIIHENLAHYPRSYRDEMRSVLQFDGFTSHESQEGFVHQGSALQRVARPLRLQMLPRKSLQLLVHHGHHRTEGLLIALDPML